MSYRLTNCVVLLAAIDGERENLPHYQALMREALAYEKRKDRGDIIERLDQSEPSRWREVAREALVEQAEALGAKATTGTEILQWAKAHKKAGLKYAGMAPAPVPPPKNKPQPAVKRYQAAETVGRIVDLCREAPRSMDELETLIGRDRRTLYRRLTAATAQGLLVRERPAREGQRGLTGFVWRAAA